MQTANEKIYTKYYVVALLALFCAFLWGSAFPSIKIGYELFSVSSSYEKIAFAGIRFFISSLLIFTFCLLSKRKLKLKRKNLYHLLALGLIQTTIQYILFYIGLSNTSGTKGSILSATNTLFSVLLVQFFYKEDKLSLKKVIGLILGFSGVVIVNLAGSNIEGGFNFFGDGFIILSSLLGAIGGIYTKKLTKEVDAFLISGYQLLLGSLFLIGAGFLGGAGSLAFSTKGLALLLYLGFVSAAAFSIWAVLLKYNHVSKVTIYKFSIPLFGVFLSYILLGERLMGTNVIASVVLVSLSIILISR